MNVYVNILPNVMCVLKITTVTVFQMFAVMPFILQVFNANRNLQNCKSVI
jgi:hypothetical protein